ncbi:MAG: CopD family protein [Rhodocyclales bacterium]|nr:CopD family protein [Rhodocyclales bacterium]
MTDWTPLLLFLHIAAVVSWVGGMFFAYQCLRPVAVEQLEPPQRLPLWVGVFGRFFPWVWAAVALILASGLAMMLQAGFRAAPLHWHLMLTIGIAMMLIFAYVFFAPYPRLRSQVAAQAWKEGGATLALIRRLVGTNLLLGYFTIAIATLGRMLSA